jgi:hypothetical protein
MYVKITTVLLPLDRNLTTVMTENQPLLQVRARVAAR